MKDFNYHQKAVDLDRRLEQVIAEAGTKAAASPDDAPIGLQAFLERSTIAEEIAETRSKAAAVESDLNVIQAREKIAGIIEERGSRFDDFSSLAAPVVDEMNKEAAEQEAMEGRKKELGDLAWHERHRPAIGAVLGTVAGVVPGLASIARGGGRLSVLGAGVGGGIGNLLGEQIAFKSLHPEAQMVHLQHMLKDPELDPEDRKTLEQWHSEIAGKAKAAGVLKDIGRKITSHPHFDAAASGAIVGTGVTGANAIANKLRKKKDDDR